MQSYDSHPHQRIKTSLLNHSRIASEVKEIIQMKNQKQGNHNNQAELPNLYSLLEIPIP